MVEILEFTHVIIDAYRLKILLHTEKESLFWQISTTKRKRNVCFARMNLKPQKLNWDKHLIR